MINALGGLVDLIGALHLLQHDDELVAPHAHHGVLGAHGRADALGDSLQELVAGLVPARIVDVLEAIEIEEQHREDAAVLSRLLDGARQIRLEIEPVGESRELIVVRQVREVLMPLEEMRLDHAAHDVAPRAVPATLDHLERGPHGVVPEPAREGLGINPLDEEDVREAQRPDFIQRVAEAAERSGIRGENLQAAGVHDQGARRPLLEHRVRLLLLGWGGARTGSQAVKRPEPGDSRDEPDEGAKTKCRLVHISPRRCTEKCGGSGSREAVRCAQFEPTIAATSLKAGTR